MHKIKLNPEHNLLIRKLEMLFNLKKSAIEKWFIFHGYHLVKDAHLKIYKDFGRNERERSSVVLMNHNIGESILEFTLKPFKQSYGR